MISLLIAVGGLFLAVFASAIFDPRPRSSHAWDSDEHAPTMDVTTLPI